MPLTRIKSLGITDGTIVNADINASAGIVTSKLSGALGITEADQWRVTTGFTLTGGSVTTITTNLERVDTAGQGILGTGMSQSSGIFTFPSTGIYLVSFSANGEQNGENRYLQTRIELTTNNSTYNPIAISGNFLKQTSSSDAQSFRKCDTLVDVTSTTNVKVRFSMLSASSTPTVNGDTDYNYTWMTFIRLGDT